MSIDRKAAIDMATQAGFKYVDHIAFRGSYNKCTTNEKYEIDCLVRLCNLSAQDAAAERDAAREAVISNCARVMTVTTERDALKDAARLALDALEDLPWKKRATDKAIDALKAVL